MATSDGNRHKGELFMASYSGRILIVEDDREQSALLRMTLEAQGYEVLEAGNGQEALHQLHESAIDTIIMDLDLPVISGVGAIQAIRAGRITRSIPILVVTGAQEGDISIVNAMSAGANDHLTKPFDPDVLVQRIGVLVNLTRIHQERSKAIRQMAGAAGHSLSQPLTAVLGHLELLLGSLDKMPEAERNHIKSAYESATQVAEILKRIQKVEEHRTVAYIGDDEIIDLEEVGDAQEAHRLAKELRRGRD